MMPNNKKIIGEPVDGKVLIDLEYLRGLRDECKSRRLRERQLLAELAQARGGNAEPVNPVAEQAP
jgi:hypothetical protein